MEKIIVSLTSWKPRLKNLPIVLDTIYNQSCPPDLVVLNLSYDEIIPEYLQQYISSHNIELYRLPNTKVFKKLIPTLRRYPDACVISIDDDFLFPSGMIEDFIEIHHKYPDFPISGNRVTIKGLQCHCGSASLTKASYFGEYLSQIDEELINQCPSDDFVYTFLCSKAGHPYIRTINEYYENMDSYNEVCSYSRSLSGYEIQQSYLYLKNRFGDIDYICSQYVDDEYLKVMVDDIVSSLVLDQRNDAIRLTRSSSSYKLGQIILSPVSFFKKTTSHHRVEDD